MVRPIFSTNNGVPSVSVGINVDFDVQNQLGTVTFNPANTTGNWDSSTWDLTPWGGGSLVINKIWQGVTGIGYTGSVNMTVQSRGIELHWASTDYVMEPGGVV